MSRLIGGGERFTLGDEIGRGGMGRVHAAHDRLLDRTVAVKLLLRDDGDALRRFEREALLTARLQHPGIVPVYDAGRRPSGEIYYAMKLVSGRTLKDLIAATTTLPERLALLPHLIGAAEAVGYAHEHGVMHRDIKPSNIVVGEFGESQVIDWGLAKEIGSADVSQPTPAASEGEQTSFGAVVGTAAFMPPEQARGLPVDARADVWALGATLYTLLAGAPPYGGKSSSEIVERVIEGHKIVPLGEREPDAPRELAAVASKAMQRDPQLRYADARGLAEALRRFQTGRLVAAHRYSTSERLGRFVARHRGAVAVSLVSLLLILGGGAYSLWRIVRERDRAHRERLAAVNERRAAEDLVRFLLSDLQVRLRPLGRLDLLEGVGERVERYYQNVAGSDRPLEAGDRARRAEALDALSKVRRARGQMGPALRAADEALALRAELARARADAEAPLDLASAHLQRAAVLRDAGRLDEAAQACRAAIDEARRAGGGAATVAQLQRLLAADAVLGATLFRQGRYRDALAVYADGRAVGRKLLAAASPSLPATLEDRRLVAEVISGAGRAHISLGEPDAALAALSESVTMQEELVARSPGDPTPLRELGTTLTRIGQIEVERARFVPARAALERSRETLLGAVAVDATDTRSQINLLAATDQLASLERGQGHFAEALRRYTEALEGTRKLLGQGEQIDVRYNLSVALQHVGIAALDLGDYAVAAARLRDSLSATRALLAADGANDRVRATAAESNLALGDALFAAGERTAADKAYDEALGSFAELAARDSAARTFAFAAALCRSRRGALALAEGHRARAVELLRRAVADLAAAGVAPDEESSASLATAQATLAKALGAGAEATTLRQRARAALTELAPRASASVPLARQLDELSRTIDAR